MTLRRVPIPDGPQGQSDFASIMIHGTLPGRWYGTLLSAQLPVSGFSVSPGDVYVEPFFVGVETPIDALGVSVVNTGQTMRLALYWDDLTGYPGQRIVEGGLTATASGINALTIARRVLEPNLYWIAFKQTIASSSTYNAHPAASWPIVPTGLTVTHTGAAYLLAAQGNGAFPAVFPAGAVPHSRCPNLFLRAAA